MKYFLGFLRIVVGVLFIFSGVVKANDPMGLVYKMDEFFQALNMTFMSHWSFEFSLAMIAFEIVCGVAVLLGYSFRFFATLLVLLNFLFLFITGYALVTGKVKECGCFGACINLSNTATFYKDIALTVMALILFVYRNGVSGLFTRHGRDAARCEAANDLPPRARHALMLAHNSRAGQRRERRRARSALQYSSGRVARQSCQLISAVTCVLGAALESCAA